MESFPAAESGRRNEAREVKAHLAEHTPGLHPSPYQANRVPYHERDLTSINIKKKLSWLKRTARPP